MRKKAIVIGLDGLEPTHDRFRLYGRDGKLLIDSWAITGPTYELRDPSTQKWTKDVARSLDRGLAAAKAGKVKPAEEVFDRLEVKYRQMAKSRQ